MGVLARSEKVEEAQREHVGDGVTERVRGLALQGAGVTDES
jgi:hypothetical protein